MRSLENGIERISVGVALLGAGLMLATALLITVSVVKRWLTAQGIDGDFDLIQLALPIAVFTFLPVCHLHRANIVVDSFTTRMPSRGQRAIDGFWSLVYAGVAGLIAWGMFQGARETIANHTTSMMIGLPIGWGMVVATVFAAWLVAAAIASAILLLRAKA